LRRNTTAIESFWVLPLTFMVGGWLLSYVVASLGRSLSVGASDVGGLSAAATSVAVPALTTIAAASITTLTFVFSTLMVLLQLASAQLSPRAIRKIIREGRTQFVMSVLAATFVFAIISLTMLYGEKEPGVALLLTSVGTLLMMMSVTTFIYFVGYVVDRVRAPSVIRLVSAETEYWLRRTYSLETPPECPPACAAAPAATDIIDVRASSSGLVSGIDTQRLLQLAEKASATIVLEIELGSAVTEGLVIGRIEGSTDARLAAHVSKAISAVAERTIEGDPAWGFRVLVDIAIKALSPAINDPTTATQVIDELERLLAILSVRAEEPGSFYDEAGVLRLQMETLSWRDHVELSVHEIYLYGAHSPQVTQRLSRMLEDLQDVAKGEDRLSALRALREKTVVVEPMVPLG
jgi:uncharacterized membrane protein